MSKSPMKSLSTGSESKSLRRNVNQTLRQWTAKMSGQQVSGDVYFKRCNKVDARGMGEWVAKSSIKLLWTRWHKSTTNRQFEQCNLRRARKCVHLWCFIATINPHEHTEYNTMMETDNRTFYKNNILTAATTATLCGTTYFSDLCRL